MFIPPWLSGWFPPGALTAPPPDEEPEPAPPAETVNLTPPRPEEPTLAEALAVLRKEVRDTVALQPRKATAPPLIVIASYTELDIVLKHLEEEAP